MHEPAVRMSWSDEGRTSIYLRQYYGIGVCEPGKTRRNDPLPMLRFSKGPITRPLTLTYTGLSELVMSELAIQCPAYHSQATPTVYWLPEYTLRSLPKPAAQSAVPERWGVKL